MKFYKIITENIIIGAVSSNNFIKYSPVADCFLRSTETEGEYVSYQDKLYRDTWMSSIISMERYIQAEIREITKEEYDIIVDAVEHDQEIPAEPGIVDPDTPVEPVDPIDEATLEFVRSSKINEMSYACRTTIEQGFDLEIQGETHHFSLTTQDQLNLMSLEVMARTENLIPYHADGETTVFFTADEINQIVSAATQLKIYNTTYFNALKTYINALETIEEISAITYGTPIPEEYQSDVYKVITE